jgi:hypothetical protein
MLQVTRIGHTTEIGVEGLHKHQGVLCLVFPFLVKLSKVFSPKIFQCHGILMLHVLFHESCMHGIGFNIRIYPLCQHYTIP